MEKMTLTAKRVERLLKVRGRYRDDQVRGLLLVVQNENSAAWTLRYEFAGRERWLGLGSAREFGIRLARERALEARRKLADGLDPLAERKVAQANARAAQDKQATFAECAVAYYEQNAERWTNAKHRAAFLSTLKQFVFPVFGARPVSEIDTALVLKALDAIWVEKRETASRVRQRIKSVLAWATTRGLRSGDNPARWDHLKTALPNGRKQALHFPALPYAELPAFLVELRHRQGVAARAVEFLILTASRSGEVLGMRWSEVDLDAGIWTVPAERMPACQRKLQPSRPNSDSVHQCSAAADSRAFYRPSDGSLA